MKKVYISGPMTGYTDHNRPAFDYAEKLLREHGYDVVNPAHNGLPETATWIEHMKADIKLLLECDAIYMLTGWGESKGAVVEHFIATSLYIPRLPPLDAPQSKEKSKSFFERVFA